MNTLLGKRISAAINKYYKKRMYKFVIRKIILNNGKELYTPMVCLRHGLLQNNWERITCIYNKYIIQELDFEPNLTYMECQQHIEGFKQQLVEANQSNVKHIEDVNITTVTF